MSYELLCGDSLDLLKEVPDNSIDADVTDGPYGIRFMGKSWDGKDIEKMVQSKLRKKPCDLSEWDKKGEKPHDGRAFAAGSYDLRPSANAAFQEWTRLWALEVYRALKPGAYLLSFCSTRTYHRMACGVEDAGFEIRDQMAWLFGSGFPKSLNLEGGYGTALKPAWEPILMARKPLIGTVAENLAEHGVGALNIEKSRIPFAGDVDEAETKGKNAHTQLGSGERQNEIFGEDKRPRVDYEAPGRWPANILHDGSDEVLHWFPNTAAGNRPAVRNTTSAFRANAEGDTGTAAQMDAGSAARFFYSAKTSRTERDAGCDEFAKKALNWSSGTQSPGTQSPGTFQSPGTEKAARNNHPTVKPVALMRYLVNLVTPKGGKVLDHFNGSGSTGVACAIDGFDYIGMDEDPHWIEVSHARIKHALGPLFA